VRPLVSRHHFSKRLYKPSPTPYAAFAAPSDASACMFKEKL
jgi:hypothetical protein